jgi:hypothetical protein
MRDHPILLIFTAIIIANPAMSDSGALLHVTAQAASVKVRPLPDDRRMILLPTLEFALIIAPQCAPDMRVESISIGVADTRKSLGASDIGDQPNVATSISIPRPQLSPLAVDGFCRAADNAATIPADLNIQDAFTANISLRCTGTDKQSIIYTSHTLHLNLQCDALDGEAQTRDDQAASSSSATAR